MMAWSGYDLLTGLGMVALVMVLGAVVLRLRKRAIETQPPEVEMTIEQLERLLGDGVISRMEFQRLRRSVLGLAERGPPAADPPDQKAEPPQEDAGARVDADSAEPPDADETGPPSAPA